jgi:cysteine-rich repeat protein
MMKNSRILEKRRAYTYALATALQLMAAGCDGSVEITVNITAPPPPNPACGDGEVGLEEECDDGAGNGNDAACKLDCSLNVCGDGQVGPGEECDDGNAVDDDACSNACVSTCGDGVVQEGEECDLGVGNVNTGECILTCLLPECGDGFVQAGEQCDDANGSQTDACLDACESAACGDGFVHSGHEQCDDGNTVGGDGCNADCTQPKRVFLTSLSYSPAMGGVVGAAARCQTRANAAGLGGTWDAWISSDSSTPLTRFIPSTAGYARLDGVIVADDWADLIDSSIDAAPIITETGSVSFSGPWTGTKADGTAAPNTCSNWTSALADDKSIVGGNFINSAWTNAGFTNCGSGRRLYCFEQ